jgi:copper transport protein
VSAHAELSRSDPGVDAIVELLPARVTLWFSEEPELRFSEIQVLDPSSRRVDRNDLRVEPNDKLGLSVGVRDGGKGTYTVLWRALSTVDGHVTRGAFGFTVGLDQTPTAIAMVADDSGSNATPSKVLVRLATYVGLAGLAGVFPFVLWILLPSLAVGAATFNTTSLILRRLWTLALAGAGLSLLAAIGALATQAAAVFDARTPPHCSAP